jgi:hypothetical protein
MYKYTLPSGSELDITLLPYEEAWACSQSILKVIEKVNIDIKGDGLEDFFKKDIMSLKAPICGVLGSPEVMHEVRRCWKRCTYNDKKIDGDSFESKDARSDFLYAAFYSLKENISPFFESLISLLKPNSATAKVENPPK